MNKTKGTRRSRGLPKTSAGVDEQIALCMKEKEELESRKNAVAAAIAEQTSTLKSIKLEIKKRKRLLERLKAQKESIKEAATAAAARALLQGKIEEMLKQGKTLNDIIDLLD